MKVLYWLPEFLRSLFYSLVDLVDWLNEDIKILGSTYKPIYLVTTGLIFFITFILVKRTVFD